MLEIEGLSASYGNITVLTNICLKINKGQVISLIGSNGAGKTTLLRTIAGLHKPNTGKIKFRGQDITGQRAYEVVKKGLSLIPEGRQLFAGMTVLDNLLLGGIGQSSKNAQKMKTEIEKMFEIFPPLKDRIHQLAGTLSGGEQQMLAIARGLMSNPEFLMLDEPSLGLAPLLVKEIFLLVKRLNETGVTIFLVEQNAHAALEISDRGYVLENGHVVTEGKASDLLNNEEIRYHYLGNKLSS